MNITYVTSLINGQHPAEIRPWGQLVKQSKYNVSPDNAPLYDWLAKHLGGELNAQYILDTQQCGPYIATPSNPVGILYPIELSIGLNGFAINPISIADIDPQILQGFCSLINSLWKDDGLELALDHHCLWIRFNRPYNLQCRPLATLGISLGLHHLPTGDDAHWWQRRLTELQMAWQAHCQEQQWHTPFNSVWLEGIGTPQPALHHHYNIVINPPPLTESWIKTGSPKTTCIAGLDSTVLKSKYNSILYIESSSSSSLNDWEQLLLLKPSSVYYVLITEMGIEEYQLKAIPAWGLWKKTYKISL